ncbi:hypothetical protein [Synechococcus elongatus]|uniref:Uncharacterized protein n=1 Tax=Synechococcus elongatus PCC 11801 TaxID=2219813 RepID=A0AAN1QLR7_SYNEL|nr:hypothetical protein [Synechococcus elongatus]AZB71669.1 hypothetical protein DOP62_02090 [Synechococcus elongatus PCC 11801]
MLSFLAILPRSLVTFFYAAAALLRFYGDAETIPFEQYGFTYTVLDWSLVAFLAASVLLLVAIGIEWHGGNRRRDQEAEDRAATAEARDRAVAAAEREARRDYLAAREAERQNRRDILQIRHQLDPSPENRAALRDFLAILEEDR